MDSHFVVAKKALENLVRNCPGETNKKALHVKENIYIKESYNTFDSLDPADSCTDYDFYRVNHSEFRYVSLMAFKPDRELLETLTIGKYYRSN